jgi:hypothetical protein
MEKFLKISELEEGEYYECGLSGRKVLVITIEDDFGIARGKTFSEGRYIDIIINDNQLMLWNTK